MLKSSFSCSLSLSSLDARGLPRLATRTSSRIYRHSVVVRTSERRGKGVHVDPIVACEEFYGTQPNTAYACQGPATSARRVRGSRRATYREEEEASLSTAAHRNKLVQKIFNMNLEVITSPPDWLSTNTV